MKISKPSFLRYADLTDLGIPWTRKHLRTLMKANKFPEAIRMGANTIMWHASEIDDWLASRPTGRAAARGATPASFDAMVKARRASPG